MLRDIASLEAGKRTHPNVVKLREQKGVDKMPALDRELRVVDRLLRDLEPRRARTEETAASSPIEFGLRLARPGDEKRQVELEKVVTLDHVRIAFPDQTRQALDRGVLRFLDRPRIDFDQFLPAGVIGNRDARDVIVRRRLEIAAGKRQHFDLHPLQFFKRQLFEKRTAGVGEVMLYRIAQREKIAPGILQSVAKCDQLLPTVGRDQPIVFRSRQPAFPRSLGRDRPRRHRPRRRDEIPRSRRRSPILLPPVNLYRPSLAQLDCNDSWGRIGTEEQLIIFKRHGRNDGTASL